MILAGAKIIRSFLKFATVSGCGWILDTGVTLALHSGGISLALSAIAGGLSAASFVFLVSRQRVFRATSTRQYGLALYLGYTLTAILAAGVAIEALSLALAQIIVAADLYRAFLAKVLITPVLLVMNFLIARSLSSQHPAVSPTSQVAKTAHSDSQPIQESSCHPTA